MIGIAASYDKNVNEEELQSTLKVALNLVKSQDFNTRLETSTFNKEFIGKFRRHCKNAKLRHLYFWLVSKNFLTMEKYLNVRWLVATGVVDVEKWNHINICCGSIER
jgi:hypothetical protein